MSVQGELWYEGVERVPVHLLQLHRGECVRHEAFKDVADVLRAEQGKGWSADGFVQEFPVVSEPPGDGPKATRPLVPDKSRYPSTRRHLRGSLGRSLDPSLLLTTLDRGESQIPPGGPTEKGVSPGSPEGLLSLHTLTPMFGF